MRQWELDQSQVVWQSEWWCGYVEQYTMRQWELDQSQVVWQSEWWCGYVEQYTMRQWELESCLAITRNWPYQGLDSYCYFLVSSSGKASS